METKTAARGRWREILLALEVPAVLLNGKQQPCPFCGGTDRFVFDDRAEGAYICRQCGAGHGISFVMKLRQWTFAQAAAEVDRVIGNLCEPKRAPYVRALMTLENVVEIWGRAKPVQDGDPVASYLYRRGIQRLAHWPVALRYAERYWHATTRSYLPCMLALYQAPDGNVGTVHRTYLGKTVGPRKMFLPHGIPPGGAIRLAESASVMGVAEGIETALSASILFGMPVWATTSERLMRKWQPPTGVRRITVFGDNDANYVGQAAAYDLASRLVLRHGYEVEVKVPMITAWDWNDAINDQQAKHEPTIGADLPQLRVADGQNESSGESVSDADSRGSRS